MKRLFNPYKFDIPAEYDIGLRQEGFETPESIEEIDEQRIEALEGGDLEAQDLACKLTLSWDGFPCLSPSKAADFSAFRRFYASGVLQLDDGWPKDSVGITIAPPWYQREKGHLDKFDIHDANRYLKSVLENTMCDSWGLIFGYDFRLVVDSHHSGEPFWQPRFHGIGLNCDWEELMKLKKYFPQSESHGVRPVVELQDTGDLIEQMSNFLNLDFKRWTPTYDRACLREPMPDLHADELRELLLFLDQYQLTDLVLMHGIRLVGGTFEI